VLDYDREAASYDATRGGPSRASAAATAVETLLPAGARDVLDVACGTGIVTALLRGPGRLVAGLDRSPGMLGVASRRMDGRVVLGDAAAMPVRSASVDVVVIVWLLHLLPSAAPVIAEAARVLRPGGVLVTTVDKNEGYFAAPSDLASAFRSLRPERAALRSDGHDRVVELAAGHGLSPAGGTTFIGAGQGRSPRRWRERIAAGVIPWAAHAPESLGAVLAALPEQDRPRPDPVYRMIALS
jgi:ubiquinone/menaquinone biosynthesis C-methylase UbiE